MDEYCALIENGVRQHAIATMWGVTPQRLSMWISEDAERLARAVAARQAAAEHWDYEAEQVLRQSPGTMAEVTRARELAQHFRWRASKIAPKQYGDKVSIDGEISVSIADRLEAARKRINGG